MTNPNGLPDYRRPEWLDRLRALPTPDHAPLTRPELRELVRRERMTETPSCVCADCVCADYAEVYDRPCGCRRCAEDARQLAGCSHHLEALANGNRGGLYVGMCDRHFIAARDVRDCGQRVSEHGDEY